MTEKNNEWEEVPDSEFWKPKTEGEELIGTYVGLEDTSKGTAVKIQTATGSMLAGYTVLKSKLSGLEGKEVRIIYLGEEPSDKGNPYKNFSVHTRRGQ